MKILFLTEGDANSPNTWSNVPYFFINSLKEAGGCTHIIVPIDISKFSWPYSLVLKMEEYFLKIVRRIFPGNPTYTACRTRLYQKAVEKNIKQAIKAHEDADCLLSTNFSHSGALLCSKKTCIFCDWTIDYLIEVMQQRSPGILERKSIERQRKEIEAADYVISLFPDVQEYMEKKYNRKVYYLGNVINSEIRDFNAAELIGEKHHGNYLFVGVKKYIQSAISLCECIAKYNESHGINIEVDIIGLKSSDAAIFESENVHCYGYLSKGNINQANQYYDLLMRAKAIVNVTKNWNGMSSLIEAMYYETPIIVSVNPNLSKTFGVQFDGGLYCADDTNAELYSKIEKMEYLDLEQYRDMCLCAHNTVKDFTWKRYAENVINILEN